MAKCDICGKDHGTIELTGIKVDSEELQHIKIITNKIDCANQALAPSVVSNCTDKNQAAFYVVATITVLSTYQSFQRDWWNKILTKYIIGTAFENLNIHIDFNTAELYTVCEANAKAAQ